MGLPFLLLGICLLSIPCAADPVRRGAVGQTRTTEIGPYPFTVTVDWLSQTQAHVFAQVTIDLPVKHVWAVLSDYNHLADFVPHMTVSRVLRREGNRVFLRQEGVLWLPFYRRQIKAVFRLQEVKGRAIFFDAVEGDFILNRGSWRLKKTGQGTQIMYTALLEPKFRLPRWVLDELERQILKAHFRAIIKRCQALEDSTNSRRLPRS